MKKRTIIFFCPKIINDGLKKTLEIYLNYFERYYKIILVTNTTNLNLLKNGIHFIGFIGLANLFV